MWPAIGRFFVSMGSNYNRGTPDTRYHNVIDAIWRIPRLLAVFLIIAMFVWSIVSPDAFGRWAEAISKLPSDMWSIIMTVVILALGVKKFGQDLNIGGRNIPVIDDEDGARLNSECSSQRSTTDAGAPTTGGSASGSPPPDPGG